MITSKDLTVVSMLTVFSLLIFPVFLTLQNRLHVSADIIKSIFRMVIQLTLIGLLLQFLFSSESLWLTSIWLVIMNVFANININRKCDFPLKSMFFYTLIPLMTGSLLILVVLVMMAIQPSPIYSARYLIPIYGMLLGNSMNACIIGAERYSSLFQHNQKEFLSYQYLGASPYEAAQRFFTESYKASILPVISNISMMGVVCLPGMMTGQILGGAPVFIAIKYQICILVGILSSVSLCSLLVLKSIQRQILKGAV
jgi:putative ABC transport system permease protein